MIVERGEHWAVALLKGPKASKVAAGLGKMCRCVYAVKKVGQACLCPTGCLVTSQRVSSHWDWKKNFGLSLEGERGAAL